MSEILTNTGLTFPDTTTQSTAAVPLTGGTMTGQLNYPTLITVNGLNQTRQYSNSFSAAQAGGSLNIMYNTGSYADIHFYMALVSYHSGRSYQAWKGVFGGYGLASTLVGGGGAFSISTTASNSAGGTNSLSAGYNYLQVSWSALTAIGNTTVRMVIYNYNGVGVVNGSLFT